MASQAELGILLSAKDTASAALHAFAGVVASSLVGALSDAANAAAEDEASVLALKTAVENSGASYDDYSGSLAAAIKKGQDLAYTDDQTRAALQMLTEETGSVDEAMKRLPVTMDLARAKHIDLEVAAKLLGKVNDENTKGLKKLGITMDAGATATDVLAKVQQIAGGQAEAYGNSTKGMIDRTKDAFAEWKESVGAAMGPAMGIVAMLPGLSSGMSIAGGAVGLLSSAIKGPMITSFLASIPATLAMMAPFLPLILILGAIALAVGLLALAWSSNFGGIQEKTAAVVAIVTGLFNDFVSFFTGLWQGLSGPVTAAIDVIMGPINGLISLVQTALGWLSSLGAAQAANAADAVAWDAANPYTGPQQPGFASGIANVPFDMTARIHKGERIITAEDNARGSWGGGLTLNLNVGGSVIGIEDLEARVRQAVVDGYRDGGFRGILR